MWEKLSISGAEIENVKAYLYTTARNRSLDFLDGDVASRNWQQLQERLAEKGITIRFKYKGQTGEIQGVSFSKGEYTFKGSEIDRNFSFSKLDKCFGDVGQTTVGSNKQTVTAPVQKSVSAPDKADNSFIVGLGGLFSGLSAPADEMPDDSFLRKKKKKKKQLKL